MNISAIDSLEAIVDGDTIVPGMNFVLPSGVGKTQYYNPSNKECTPDYSKLSSKILLYPYCYSSNTGKFLVPSTSEMMWYLNDPSSSNSQILVAKGGAIAEKYKNMFELTSYTVNNQTFPALRIIGNLASADNLNDVSIYFKSVFNDMEITCHGDISIRESVGEMYDILINCVNESGISDTVIDNDSEFLVLSASLQNCGVGVEASGWSWMRATPDGLVAVSNVSGVTEISNGGKTLKLYDGAIEGTEEYFACVKHNGTDYKKGIQVCDTHDPFYINVGRSQSSNLIKQNESVTYTPQVLARSSRAVQSGWKYTFIARSNNGSIIRQASNVSTFSVEGSEVHEYGGLNIHISATKS